MLENGYRTLYFELPDETIGHMTARQIIDEQKRGKGSQAARPALDL